MTSEEGPSATTRTGGASRPRPGTLIAQRTRLAARRRRPWWKWLLIGLLLAFSVATTSLYAATVIRDLSLRHWGAALDASRDAVPAAVGWAALALVFFPRRSPAAAELLSADNDALSERLRQAARDQASLDNAEQKVQRLTARLAGLTAARGRAVSTAGIGPEGSGTAPAGAGTGPEGGGIGPEGGDAPADCGVTYLDPGAVYLGADDAELQRDVAATTARLDQARQWLTSARDALAASQRAVADAEERLMIDFPELARRSDRTAHKPALAWPAAIRPCV